MMPLPQFGLSENTRPTLMPRQGARGAFIRKNGDEANDQATPVYPKVQGENAEGMSGNEVGASMLPQQFLDQVTDMRAKGGQFLDMAKQPVQSLMDVGGRMKDLEQNIRDQSDIASNIETSSAYDPSALRKILGIGYGLMGGGYKGYRDIADFPRNRAMAAQAQKIAGLQNIQKLMGEEAGAYKGAGSDIAATADAYARLGGSAASMMTPFIPKFAPTETMQDGQPGTVLRQENQGFSGYPGMIAPGSFQAKPQDYTYKDVMTPTGPEVQGFSKFGGPPLKTGSAPQPTSEESMLASSPEGRRILQDPALYAKFKRDQSYREEVLAAEQLRHNDQMLAQTYRFNDEQLQKESDPLNQVMQRAQGVGERLDMGERGNSQADSEAAAAILSLTVGGQASGLKMNQALLDRVAGGGNKWEALEQQLRQWSVPGNRLIGNVQRKQMRDIVGRVVELANEKQNIINDARASISTAKDPVTINQTKVDAMRKLQASTGGAGGGGGRSWTVPDGEVAGFLKTHPNVKQVGKANGSTQFQEQ